MLLLQQISRENVNVPLNLDLTVRANPAPVRPPVLLPAPLMVW